jgi:hypothetical protein
MLYKLVNYKLKENSKKMNVFPHGLMTKNNTLYRSMSFQPNRKRISVPDRAWSGGVGK